MLRNFSLRAIAPAAFGLAIAATTLVGTGTAPASANGFIAVGGFISVNHICPYGTHLGYDGRYCWPNHYVRACPYGTHLGYEGRYCWPNHH